MHVFFLVFMYIFTSVIHIIKSQISILYCNNRKFSFIDNDLHHKLRTILVLRNVNQIFSASNLHSDLIQKPADGKAIVGLCNQYYQQVPLCKRINNNCPQPKYHSIIQNQLLQMGVFQFDTVVIKWGYFSFILLQATSIANTSYIPTMGQTC